MIDCHKCEHYYVTWDKHFPNGCRAMKFKSHEFPSSVVYKSSGVDCLMFKSKKKKHQIQDRKDKN